MQNAECKMQKWGRPMAGPRGGLFQKGSACAERSEATFAFCIMPCAFARGLAASAHARSTRHTKRSAWPGSTQRQPSNLFAGALGRHTHGSTQ